VTFDNGVPFDTRDAIVLPGDSQGSVAGDGGEPGSETVWFIEVGDGAEGKEKSVLDDVFGFVRARDGCGDSHGGSSVASGEFAKRVGVTVAGGYGEREIGGFFPHICVESFERGKVRRG